MRLNRGKKPPTPAPKKEPVFCSGGPWAGQNVVVPRTLMETLVFRVGQHYGRYKRPNTHSAFNWHDMEKPNG